MIPKVTNISEKYSIGAIETPSQYAERLGKIYAAMASSDHKKELGQFFTPIEIAHFMADSINSFEETVRILDPGCGLAILSASICESLLRINSCLKSIDLVAFETDVEILPFAEASLNYLRQWLEERGIQLNYFLCKNDFILHNSHVLNSRIKVQEAYDIIISNPPYFKLSKDDFRFKVTHGIIPGQTNIYTIFMIISARLLKTGGKMSFITPRSFCSGSYFRLFREQFFNLVDISRIHLFESRTDTFKKDKVLQETLIISAIGKITHPQRLNELSLFPKEQNVIVSSSEGIADLETRSWMQYPLSSLVNLNSEQKIIYLPSTNEDDMAIAKFRTWTEDFDSLGIGISTGKVVDFRNVDSSTDTPLANSVPFIHLKNVLNMKFSWPLPLDSNKGKRKQQYFLKTDSSQKVLVPNLNYVLLRRFSSKDDARKLIACPYIKARVPGADSLAIENHLNYIYKLREEFSENEAIGVAAILNSELFDRYFRTFNGNINVSATELKSIKLPDMGVIRKIGDRLNKGGVFTSKKIDQIVNKYLNVEQVK